jgi:hypothetical protein
MPLKKLKGARLICPCALTEDTQAIGRGMSALVSKSCASRAGSVLRSISMFDSPIPSRRQRIAQGRARVAHPLQQKVLFLTLFPYVQSFYHTRYFLSCLILDINRKLRKIFLTT